VSKSAQVRQSGPASSIWRKSSVPPQFAHATSLIGAMTRMSVRADGPLVDSFTPTAPPTPSSSRFGRRRGELAAEPERPGRRDLHPGHASRRAHRPVQRLVTTRNRAAPVPTGSVSHDRRALAERHAAGMAWLAGHRAHHRRRPLRRLQQPGLAHRPSSCPARTGSARAPPGTTSTCRGPPPPAAKTLLVPETPRTPVDLPVRRRSWSSMISRWR
jgi:hypothetical protein